MCPNWFVFRFTPCTNLTTYIICPSILKCACLISYFSPQVDFAKAVIIVRVATQGRQDYRQWVTQYYLRYALDGIHFVDYKQKHARKVRIKQSEIFCTYCAKVVQIN